MQFDPFAREINKIVTPSEPTGEQETQKHFFILPDEIKETLSTPLKKVGFPIEDNVEKVFDPSYQPHHHYRSYVKGGYLAYLYCGKGLLDKALQARNWCWVGLTLASHGARGIYFFSDVKRVADQYKTMGQQWVNQLENLVQVRFFTEEYIPNLEKADVDLQIQLVKEWFSLDKFKPDPRIGTGLTWKDFSEEGKESNEDKNCIINIIANQAGHAPSNLGSKGYLSDLINKTMWPNSWKMAAKGCLKGIPEPDSRELFNYAIGKGSLPNEPSSNALGNLLEKIIPDLGNEDCTTTKELIAKYNLAPVKN